MQKLMLALDWTPNINHIGFFVAQHKGFYKKHGVEVTISDPSEDNYAVTPAKKVELGFADLALCPTESILSYRTKSATFSMIAIAAILQEDLSAIAVRADSNIISPKDLDGQSYASYKARYEDKMVMQMMKNDGGKGDLLVEYPNKLGIWETLTKEKYKSTWIFTNWEGVEAEQMGIDLRLFRMKDYQIPYSYSPVIAINEQQINKHSDAFKSFLKASKEGFMYSVKNPDEATAILRGLLPKKDKSIDLLKALERTSTSFGTSKTWGKMDEKVVSNFLDWIYENNLEEQKLDVSDLITNILN